MDEDSMAYFMHQLSINPYKIYYLAIAYVKSIVKVLEKTNIGH